MHILLLRMSPANVVIGEDVKRWLQETSYLGQIAPLKALFVRSPDELVLRVSRLLIDPGFNQTYTDRSVHLCSRLLGIYKNAVDALASIFLEEEQA